MPRVSSTITYPPKNAWNCPVCGKKHSKPHFAFPGQIDFKKKPEQVGRVKFDREDPGGCDDAKGDTPKKHGNDKTGPELSLTECNQEINNPLFCPHCGWIDEITNIIKVSIV